MNFIDICIAFEIVEKSKSMETSQFIDYFVKNYKISERTAYRWLSDAKKFNKLKENERQ